MLNQDELAKFLDELVASANESAEGALSFSHTFVNRNIGAVIPCILKEVHSSRFVVSCNLNGTSWHEPVHEFFLAAKESGTCIWQFCVDTGLMASISKSLALDVHWVSVDEGTRLRCYQNYSGGKLVREELDPEALLRGEAIESRRLRGTGPRKFVSTGDFLERIGHSYTPVDMVWRFGKWKDSVWRDETLARPNTQVRGAVRLVVRVDGSQIDGVGELESTVVPSVPL